MTEPSVAPLREVIHVLMLHSRHHCSSQQRTWLKLLGQICPQSFGFADIQLHLLIPGCSFTGPSAFWGCPRPIVRERKATKHDYLGKVQEVVYVFCSAHFLWERGKHKQNPPEIPAQSRKSFVYVFCCLLFFVASQSR